MKLTDKIKELDSELSHLKQLVEQVPDIEILNNFNSQTYYCSKIVFKTSPNVEFLNPVGNNVYLLHSMCIYQDIRIGKDLTRVYGAVGEEGYNSKYSTNKRQSFDVSDSVHLKTMEIKLFSNYYNTFAYIDYFDFLKYYNVNESVIKQADLFILNYIKEHPDVNIENRLPKHLSDMLAFL